MRRFLLFNAVVALILAGGRNADASNITFSFDPDGAGSGVAARDVTTFDFWPGNALADNALLGSPALLPGTVFDLYFQAVLNGISDASGSPTVAQFTGGSTTAGFFDMAGIVAIPQGQITVVAGFTEIVTGTSVAGDGDVTSSFALAGGGLQTVNFVKLYYDGAATSTVADDLAGTGFDDGTLILDAIVTRNSGSFAVDVQSGTGNLFDGVGADDYGGLTSVKGSGGVELTAQVLSFDPTFFGAGFSMPGLVTLALVNTSNITPFDQVNPSMLFSPDGIAGGATITPNLGDINGSPTMGVAPFDFQFQSDANASFQIVPEPSSLLLCGLGALGFFGREIRRRRTSGRAAA
jgi:hypothetical protein